MKEVRVEMNACKIGDIVARDILNLQTGVILCAKGHIFTAEVMLLLGKFNHTSIYIIKDNDEKVWKVSHEVLEAYNESKDIIKTVLNGVKEDRHIDPSHIKKIKDNFTRELDSNSNIMGCVNRIKSIDDYTYYHSINVGMLAVVIGKWLKLSKTECDTLFMAGILHDVGKYKIDFEILNKPCGLTKREYQEVKKHVLYSYQAVKNIEGINYGILEGILTHHERMDGSGYPRSLQNEGIHLYGRILAVADVYDAMTSERIYKKHATPFAVMEEMYTQGINKLDPEILLLFLNNIAAYYLEVEVLLSNGQVGEVVFIHPECVYKPIIKIGDRYIDLMEKDDIKIIDIV